MEKKTEAYAKAEKAAVNERINRKLPPSIHDALEDAKKEAVPPFGHDLVTEDDLVIEDDGVIGRDMGLTPGGQAGKILFDSSRQAGECPDKLEPAPNNRAARESLEGQISDLMAKANQSLKEFDRATKAALDVLEMARTSAYTEPMGEVSVTIFEAARRLPEFFARDSRVLNKLGNLALEIGQSEQKEENDGKK